jgi:hypothetical protein
MSNPVDEDQPPAPAETTGRRRPPIRIIALVAAVIIAGGGFVAYQAFFAKETAAPGECASVIGVAETAKLTVVGCSDKAATFKIALKKDLSETSCPEGAYRELRDDKALICLMPNFVAGNCYEADDENQAFKVTPCEGTESIEITEVLNGTTDPSSCPDGNGFGYPEPPTVFCIGTPGAS